MTDPYIIKPNNRYPSRTKDGKLEIVIGGDWSWWKNPMFLDGKPILPIAVEKIMNYRGGSMPLTKITVGDVEIGEHRLQLEDGFVIVFHTLNKTW